MERISSPPPEVEQFLEKQNWTKITKKLAPFASFWLSTLNINHLEPHDLIADAIIGHLSGSRKTDITKLKNEHDLVTLLKWTIRSIVSKIRKSKDATIIEKADTTEIIEAYATADASDAQLEIEAAERLDQFYNTLNDDEDAQQVLLATMDGFKKPSDIATYLRWDVDKVNYTLKRMRRKISKAN